MIEKGQHDLTNERFRDFVLIRRVNSKYWIGECVHCGDEKEIPRRSITVGANTRCKRCGIFRKGRTYNSWRAMIERCSYAKHEYYPIYGGRGIKVCEQWLNYDNFFKDMGQCPPGMMLDRINNDGNYEPSNCRWLTSLDSGANKRNNRYVICFGAKVIINEANRRLGMSRHYLRATMQNCGWPEIDVGILPSTNSQGFLRRWLRGSCRIEFTP